MKVFKPFYFGALSSISNGVLPGYIKFNSRNTPYNVPRIEVIYMYYQLITRSTCNYSTPKTILYKKNKNHYQ